jgi:3-oxosteroid 1-dehydrogenase
MDADVVIVGSGAAGLTAALTTARRGARVVVLERARLLGGTSAMSGGMLWIPNNRYMRAAGIADSRDEALTYIRRLTSGRVADELIQTYVDECNSTIDFLEAHTSIRFASDTRHPDYQPELPGGKAGGRGLSSGVYDTSRLGSFEDQLRFGPNDRILDLDVNPDDPRAVESLNELNEHVARSGRALVGQLLEACLEHGVEFEPRTRALELVRQNDRVCSVRADQDGAPMMYTARWGVMLACGGFEWNQALLTRFMAVPLVAPSSSPSNQGDGLIMAMQVGAALGNMTEAWWAPAMHVPGEAYEDGPLNRHVSDPRSKPGSIVVNRRGRRFTNEALNYNDFPRAMMTFDAMIWDYPNIPCYLVFDEQFRRSYRVLTMTPESETPSWLINAPTVTELAEAAGIDPVGLRAELEYFNNHARLGQDPIFHRGEGVYDRYRSDQRLGRNASLRPLGPGPFYALEMRLGGLGTKGGPVIDCHARVLDPHGACIPGLYAAGNISASVFGPSYPGPGATLGPATTFARLAGEHMAVQANA